MSTIINYKLEWDNNHLKKNTFLDLKVFGFSVSSNNFE